LFDDDPSWPHVFPPHEGLQQSQYRVVNPAEPLVGGLHGGAVLVDVEDDVVVLLELELVVVLPPPGPTFIIDDVIPGFVPPGFVPPGFVPPGFVPLGMFVVPENIGGPLTVLDVDCEPPDAVLARDELVLVDSECEL